MALACAACFFAAPASGQQPFIYSTGSCSGCSNCLMFLSGASFDPVRTSAGCNSSTNCGDTPSRFADLSTLRGLLQIVNSSSDGSSCPQALINTARWDSNGFLTIDDADVVFTGPAGQTTVSTRVRYIISTSTTGVASLSLTARLESSPSWANEMAIPSNVSGFEVVSPPRNVNLGSNSHTEHWASITSHTVNGSSCYLLHFPLNEPVFDLPPGYTANCAPLGLVNNIWHGLDYEGDWNASTGPVPCFNTMHLLHSVTGNLTVVNTGERTIDLGLLSSAGGNIVVSSNPGATTIDLGLLSSAGGDIVVTSNPGATTIDLGLLSSAGGDIVVTSNPGATTIDLGQLSSASDVTVENNGSEAAPLAGASPLTVNLASLANVDGNLTVANNIADTTVLLGPLTLVVGNLTLETNVTGTLDLSATAVAGDIAITARQAQAALVRTPPPAKATSVTIARVDSTIDVLAPADTFLEATTLTTQKIADVELPVEKAEDADDQPIRVRPLLGAHVDAQDEPLVQDMTIALKITLDEIPEPMQTEFLIALAEGRAMLVTRDEENPATDLYEAFAICIGKDQPTAGGCATMQLLDANHEPAPGIEETEHVRIVCKTNHLSRFALAIKLHAGDVTGDGVVSVDDLLAVINAWGSCPTAAPATCAADMAPDPAGDGVVNVDDLLMVINNWG